MKKSDIVVYYLRYMGRKYQGDKLYWRRLVNGKYTWKRADVVVTHLTRDGRVRMCVDVPRHPLEDEE